MLIDTHAHLNFKAYKDDSDEVIQRALTSDTWMINVGSQYKTSERAVEMAEKHEKGAYAAVGLHPIHVDSEEFDKEKYKGLAKNSKVVAIGETGLDYYHIVDEEARKRQKLLLQQHLKLAKELNKPIILHCRKAYDDLLSELEGIKLPGVVHCFLGRWNQAEQFLKMGFYLGFTGVVTYSRDYDKVIKNTPLNKILIETDCPYLTPEPHRGERNEPSYVKYVAEKIAEIKEISFDKVIEQTTKNAKELFKI
jgi:TatD DNase family protein